MARAGHRTGRRTRLHPNWWLAFAGLMLGVTVLRAGFAVVEAREAAAAERLAQVGVPGTATRCEYVAVDGEGERIVLSYAVGGTTVTAEPRHARLDALYGWDWTIELEDGRHDISPASGYSCPLEIRWDPDDPGLVVAEQDLRYVAGGLERESAMEDVTYFGVITLLAFGLWLLVSTARAAQDRRSRSPGQDDLRIGFAVALTGVVALMNASSVIELLADREPVELAQVLNQRGALSTATSCRVLVRDAWGVQVVVTFEGDGRTHTQPLAFTQELTGDGGDDVERADGFHESPEGQIYTCPLEVRYDPDDPERVMAQRDVVYFFEGSEHRWNLAVLVGWSIASLTAAAFWVMWWPPRPRPLEAS